MGLCETFSTCFVSADKDKFCQLKFRPGAAKRSVTARQGGLIQWRGEEPSAAAEGSEGLSGL